MFSLTFFLFSSTPTKIDGIDGDYPFSRIITPRRDRVLIDSVGDIRAVLGPQGKNIAVSQNGEAIAVIYGAPTNDSLNPMGVNIAYSLDHGITWANYGPFSPHLSQVHPCVDGVPDFNSWWGGLWFGWQESPDGYATGKYNIMIEEGTPANPAPDGGNSLPNSFGTLCPWFPCIAVEPGNFLNIIATAYSYLANGNNWAYCWISNDGGYTWTDTIAMCYIYADGAPGHLRRGTGGYMFYAYLDSCHFGATDRTPYPHYIESTDGGYTWSAETPFPNVPVDAGSRFCWHELDCEVINGEPWAVYTDLGTSSMWLLHGIGSPGNWTWKLFDVMEIGACSTWVGDTVFYCYPSQYPSIAYDPYMNIVLVSYKAYFYKRDTTGWTVLDGAHIGGVARHTDWWGWQLQLLSMPNTGQIAWDSWNVTETAHRLAADGYAYSIWVDSTQHKLYFEKERLVIYCDVEGMSCITKHVELSILPTISAYRFQAILETPMSYRVCLDMYDVTGRIIKSLYSGYVRKGRYVVDINTEYFADGTYFVVLTTKCGQQVVKIIVAR